MNSTIARAAGFAIGLALFAHSADAQSIATLWNTPSRLTPSQAADVLYRLEEGKTVAASDLFEAEKYLRTDGATSLGSSVLTSVIQRRLQTRLGAEYGQIRVRILPHVNDWLETVLSRDSSGTEIVEVRGESLIVTMLNEDPNLAAVLVHHLTLGQAWKKCGTTTPCNPSSLATPVRSQIAYETSVPLEGAATGEAASSELILATGFKGQIYFQTYPGLDQSRYLGRACDPLPSQTIPTTSATGAPLLLFRHTASKTLNLLDNDALCSFFALSGGTSATFTYLVGGQLAQAPASAARSAVVNNPLSFDLFQ